MIILIKITILKHHRDNEIYMKTKHRGFTLLELMVTVAIVSIIATIALWNSSDMLEENRGENFLLELKRNISFARSQAASTDEIVIVCAAPGTKVKSSDKTLTCSSKWDVDQIIITFIDANNNGQYNNETDSLIRVMEEISPNDRVSFTDTRIRFNTSGRITTNPGNFIFCPNGESKNQKALTLTQSGTAFYLGDTTESCS